jgi:hypothetical protein
MLLTFIGSIAVAVLGACIAFVVNRTTGINARWIIPAAAGAGMLGFTLWNDYTWFGRNVEGLPATVVVTARGEQSHAIQPWTLAVPTINRFQAVDLASVIRHPDRPGIRAAGVLLAQRYQPTFTTPQVFDCAEARRADANVGPFDEHGLPVPAAWVAVPEDDPLLRAVCDAAPMG